MKRSQLTTVLMGFAAGLVLSGSVIAASKTNYVVAQAKAADKAAAEECTRLTGVPCAKFDDEPLCACANLSVPEATLIAKQEATPPKDKAATTEKRREPILWAG